LPHLGHDIGFSVKEIDLKIGFDVKVGVEVVFEDKICS
jgi:hypothetical protein